ncbi:MULTISPECIES: A24 family peptidase [unclassified Nocardioides]|uniref:prepilin peptidase n=1 Tax=unclassified Nocardioides TaxID=2615069 RepID=UPI0000570063|nr:MULTISPECIES: A24 family peptidase [unclassified Nocardioides]ABL81916.1 peptidase A24A, prepilin type IV [Nocardioides sp. JS614]
MSVDPGAVVLGAAACGAAGLLVPALIARIPEPDADPEHDVVTEDPGAPSYAEVAAAPGLRSVAAVLSLVAGGLVGAGVGLDWPLLFLLPLVPVGVALAVVDLRTRLLPTVVVWPTLAATAVLAVLSGLLDDDQDALVRAGLGGVVVFALFFALWWIHPAGMGYGDVRLSAVLGLALGYLGWAELAIGIYGGFLAFSVPGLLLALLRRDRAILRAAYPFGPFLLAGALAGVVLGPLWTGLASG